MSGRPRREFSRSRRTTALVGRHDQRPWSTLKRRVVLCASQRLGMVCGKKAAASRPTPKRLRRDPTLKRRRAALLVGAMGARPEGEGSPAINIGGLSAAATRPEAERSSALHCPAGAESRPARNAADQQNRCAADAIGRDMKFEISRGTGGSFLVVTAPKSRTSIIVETPRESAILTGRKPRGSR